jgi:hypothetical protein
LIGKFGFIGIVNERDLLQNKELGLTPLCRDVKLNDCVVNWNVQDDALFRTLSQSDNQSNATILVVVVCDINKNSLILSNLKAVVI